MANDLDRFKTAVELALHRLSLVDARAKEIEQQFVDDMTAMVRSCAVGLEARGVNLEAGLIRIEKALRFHFIGNSTSRKKFTVHQEEVVLNAILKSIERVRNERS